MLNALFIASTGQNQGKTTICLGMTAALLKKLPSVGFIKPVGQRHVEVDNNIRVDKDVVLFAKNFSLDIPWEMMSPVIIPRGFTKKYLDGHLSTTPLFKKIEESFQWISKRHAFTIVEGTGHVGVGSIFGMNNAQVARALNLAMIIIVEASLGAAFDDLTRNIALCKEENVPIKGVILNRVFSEKRETTVHYFKKALDKLNIPLLGAIPYSDFLHNPTLKDFENLFKEPLLSGEEYAYRHFDHFRLVAGSLKLYLEEMVKNECIITPSSREDIILATIRKHQQEDWEGGFVFTGSAAPREELLDKLRAAHIPALYTHSPSFDAMGKITSFITKISANDNEKIQKAIKLVEDNISIDQLI